MAPQGARRRRILTMDLAEKMTRPGLLGLAGRVKENACKRELRTFFAELGQKILGLDLQSVADVPKSDQMVKHAVELKVRNLLRSKSDMFEAIMRHHLEQAFLLASKMDYVQEADGKNKIDKLGQTGVDAAEWAKQHAAKLVKGVNETIIDLLSGAVSKGIETMAGPDGTGRLIRDAVDDMSTRRADMIATTEMNRAMSKAAIDKMARIGVEYKQIILVEDACDICQSCADEDPKPVDEPYNTGDDGPPFHPNCRCAVTGARPPSDLDESLKLQEWPDKTGQDDHGRVADNSHAPKILYHGTSSIRADSVEKNGLQPRFPGLPERRSNKSLQHLSHAWLTHDRKDAMSYAKQTAKLDRSSPVVFQVDTGKLPSQLKRTGDGWAHYGTIPSSAMKRI